MTMNIVQVPTGEIPFPGCGVPVGYTLSVVEGLRPVRPHNARSALQPSGFLTHFGHLSNVVGMRTWDSDQEITVRLDRASADWDCVLESCCPLWVLIVSRYFSSSNDTN